MSFPNKLETSEASLPVVENVIENTLDRLLMRTFEMPVADPVMDERALPKNPLDSSPPKRDLKILVNGLKGNPANFPNLLYKVPKPIVALPAICTNVPRTSKAGPMAEAIKPKRIISFLVASSTRHNRSPAASQH